MQEDKVSRKAAAKSVLEESNLAFQFAHDFRTYLRTILTRIQLVQNSGAALLPREDQLMLQEVAAAASNMNGLLNSMVAYCEGPVDGSEDLRLLLRGVLLERKAELAAVGAEVAVVNDLNMFVPAGLKSVLKELLINACRFRSVNRPLRIAVASRMSPASQSGDSSPAVEVAVTDNGIGVEPACLEKIFAPFYRLHSRDEFPGHGLGLATCRRFVERWGGTIAAEPAPEHGLTLRVTVPADAA